MISCQTFRATLQPGTRDVPGGPMASGAAVTGASVMPAAKRRS